MRFNTISYSAMDLFLTCQLSHNLKYVKKVDPIKGDQTALHFGSLIHKALEVIRRNPDPDMISEFVDKAAGTMKFDVKSSMIKDAKEILKGWLLDRDFTPEIVNIEWRFDRQLPSADFRINGYIDLVEMDDDGVMNIIDYKSGNWIYHREELEDSLQLMMYAIAVWDEWRPKAINIGYDMVKFNRIVRRVTRSDMVESIKRIKNIKSMMEKCRNPIAELSQKCSWCERRHKCNTFMSLPEHEQDFLVIKSEDIGRNVKEFNRLQNLEKAVKTRKNELKGNIEMAISNHDEPVLDLGDIKARLIYSKEQVYDPGVVAQLIPIEDVGLVMEVKKGKMDGYIKQALEQGNMTNSDRDTIITTADTKYKRPYLRVDPVKG